MFARAPLHYLQLLLVIAQNYSQLEIPQKVIGTLIVTFAMFASQLSLFFRNCETGCILLMTPLKCTAGGGKYIVLRNRK